MDVVVVASENVKHGDDQLHHHLNRGFASSSLYCIPYSEQGAAGDASNKGEMSPSALTELASDTIVQFSCGPILDIFLGNSFD